MHSPQQSPDVTPDASTEEVRVAMALNGGVSLAVWMGGCAVELDCARRAHLAQAAPAPAPGSESASRGNTAGASRGNVYQMLCSALDRELVIDIMSGASAGGINGALLAAAISQGRRLNPDFVRDRWIQLGDFSSLLQPLSSREPRSLMSGDLFHTKLLETFKAVLGTSEDSASNAASALPPDERPAAFHPVLDVTTTNLVGEERLFRDDWGETLVAREYRARFRFREVGDYTAMNLASAARASASFPLAFEPWKVSEDDARRLARFPMSRWVLDGGLLDNAPIRLALEAIPNRPASRQVRRFVCYVNGDPPEREPEQDGVPPEPDLEGVLGAIVTLPRKAPFADELTAIESASRRSSINRSGEVPLLDIELDALEKTATGLLPVYRRRRRLRSLLDVLGQPQDAKVAFERMDRVGEELPWIPVSLDVPAKGTWGWGIEVARRVHHLALDLIRFALPEGKNEGRQALLQARIDIDSRLADLDRRRTEFKASPCVLGTLQAIASDPQADVSLELASLAGFTAPRDGALYDSVYGTVSTVYDVSVQLGVQDGVPIGEALFGESWLDSTQLSANMVDCFLRRALAIEVTRRAFTASEVVEDAQDLAFAQLTPFAPTPILSSSPMSAPARLTPKEKLTGVTFGHFGAFYRGSWRANDFMWGRLDGASRIVNMLLEASRATELHERDGSQPWLAIADSLLDGADEDRRWLIEEVLDDAACPPEEDLGARLRAAVEHDLMNGDSALTRTICIRAAQLEILREELPQLIAQAAQDEAKGSSPNALDLTVPADSGEMKAAIESLREGDPLPRRLGLDTRAEATSTLAVRTGARASLVSLGVLRDGVPLTLPLQILRAFLLPMAGVVAQHWYNRVGVVLAFVASAWFLAARTVTTMNRPADLAHLSTPELLVSAIALLVVLGTTAVPAYRLVRGDKTDWAIQGVWVALLLGIGVLATIVLAMTGPLNVGQLIVQPGATAVPTILLAPTVLIVLGIVLVPVPLIGSQLTQLFQQAWAGAASSVLAFLAAGCLIGWAQAPLRHALAHGQSWQVATALVALVGAPLIAIAFLLLRDPANRLRAGERGRAAA